MKPFFRLGPEASAPSRQRSVQRHVPMCSKICTNLEPSKSYGDRVCHRAVKRTRRSKSKPNQTVLSRSSQHSAATASLHEEVVRRRLTITGSYPGPEVRFGEVDPPEYRVIGEVSTSPCAHGGFRLTPVVDVSSAPTDSPWPKQLSSATRPVCRFAGATRTEA